MNPMTPPASKEGTPRTYAILKAKRENSNYQLSLSQDLLDHAVVLELENQSLQRRVGELEGDKARLDWLEKNANFIEVGHGDISPDRAAIDAARATLHQGDKA